MLIDNNNDEETIVVKTWKGNRNGTILLALPNIITKEYKLEKPTHIVLEKQADGIFLRKLVLEEVKK